MAGAAPIYFFLTTKAKMTSSATCRLLVIDPSPYENSDCSRFSATPVGARAWGIQETTRTKTAALVGARAHDADL